MDTTALFEQVEKIKMPVRIVIFFGTIILLAVAFTYFFYLPKTAEITKTENKNEELEQRLNLAKNRAKKLKQFEEDFAQVNTQFKEALKLLPDSKEIPSLLSSISQLGTDSALTVNRFDPQNERSQDFYMEIPVSLEVRGPYHNVAVFFDKVGRMERIVNILNVSMKPIQDRSSALVTTCDAVTYRFKGESDVTNTAQNKKK